MRARRQAPAGWTLVAAFVVLAATVAGAAPTAAQAVPELMLGARDTTVWLYVPTPPEPNYGFVVYRTGPDGDEQRLTDQPVRPLTEPATFVAAVGPELDRALATVDATDGLSLLRRVQATPLTSHVMSLLYRGVARGLGRGYLDPDVEPGERYRYRVVYVGADDQETDAVREGAIDVADREPAPPDEVAIVAAAPSEVIVGWEYPEYTGEPSDLVVAFEVERAAGDGAFRRVSQQPVVRNDAAPLRFVDRAVVPGRSYRYRIRATDMVDRIGAPSEAVVAVTTDPRPPRAPTGLETDPGDGQVALRWRIAPDPAVAGYVVERSTGIDAPYERLNETPVPALEPTYLDTTAVGTIRYFYRVASVDSAGRVGPAGNGVVAVPHDWTPPAPVPTPAVDVADRRIRIRWSPSPSADVIGYHVYRGDAPNRMGRLTGEPLSDTTFLDTGFDGAGLRPGQRYAVSVTAVDRAYNESDPSLVEAAIPDDEAPAVPTGLVLESHHGRHTIIRWTGSPSLDVAGFILQRTTGVGEPVTLAERPVDAPRRLRDTTAVGGTTYEYRLIAVDTAGNRSAPASDTITLVDPTPPPAPRHAGARVADTGVEVRWERVVAPDLAGYRVYRSTLPTGTFTAVSPLITPEEDRVWTDPEGEAAHYYTVRAVDADGNTSAPSPAVSGGGR